MTLNTYKINTQHLCERKGWDTPNIEEVWLLFTEEIGELASCIRRIRQHFCDQKKFKVEDELGDVFSYLFQISYMLNIDLDKMWEHHVKKAVKKKYIKKTNF
jgi:NTP pyrophosphatase (non-canonical NTP hydrolase)